jgi:hypothetical protein
MTKASGDDPALSSPLKMVKVPEQSLSPSVSIGQQNDGKILESNDYLPSEAFSLVDEEERPLTKEDGDEHRIGKRETVAVTRLRLVVVLVLVISTVAASFSIHSYLTRSETERFESQFHDDSHKILEATGSTLDKTLGLLDSIAVLYVSEADFTNQSWPFVTMPNFAVRMAKVLPLTDAIIINVLPYVKNELRAEWEAYTVSQHGWVEQSMKIQDHWEGYYGPIVYNSPPNGVLHSDFADLPYNETYVWQKLRLVRLARTTVCSQPFATFVAIAETEETFCPFGRISLSLPMYVVLSRWTT